jgi:hypothetical protein
LAATVSQGQRSAAARAERGSVGTPANAPTANINEEDFHMVRKMGLAIGVCVALSVAVGVASATAAPLRLYLSESGAFAVLGHWCGGISQKVYATGFDAKGFPTGAELLSTSCGGSGRDGGGHSTTYTAWASSEWNWSGQTRKFAASSTPEGISEAFSAEDAHGDHLYNVGTAAYLEDPAPPLSAPAAPTGVSAYAQEVEVGEKVERGFQVTWANDPENAALMTSSHVVATPVGSTGPVLEATASGASTGLLVAPLERRTTYRITVTSTDLEGTSEASGPIEVNSITPEEEREQKLEEAEPQAPEFGRCVKAFHEKVGTTTYYYGGFTTAGCGARSISHTGKYEWYEGVEEGGFTTALKLGPVTFERVNRAKITCTGESGSGTITGRKTVGDVVVTLTGCESAGQKCTTSGLAEGEMSTNSLEGALGVIGQTETLGKVTNHIGIDLFPTGKSGAVLEYACGGVAGRLSGSVIAPVTANKMQTTSTLKFSQTAGLQKPEGFEGQPQDVLTNGIGEQVGLALSATLHGEEAVEMNGVIEPGEGG